MSTGDENLHNRSVTDSAFYEWLLSDHPAARAERERRRTAAYEHARDRAATVRAWVNKINALAQAPQTTQGLAASMGPLAEQSAARAETDYAEPDDLYVARTRAQLETHMRVSGPPDSWDYRYPEHLTGPSAANYPPPPAGTPKPDHHALRRGTTVGPEISEPEAPDAALAAPPREPNTADAEPETEAGS